MQADLFPSNAPKHVCSALRTAIDGLKHGLGKSPCLSCTGGVARAILGTCDGHCGTAHNHVRLSSVSEILEQGLGDTNAEILDAGRSGNNSTTDTNWPGSGNYPTSPCVIVVDAGSSIEGADRLVAHLLPQALNLDQCVGANTRSTILLGVLAVGPGCWTRINDRASDGCNADAFMPVQSFEESISDSRHVALTSERLAIRPDGNAVRVVPVGLVAWAGVGLTRKDALCHFDGTMRGGDGELLLLQVIAEIVSKVGLSPKFGA
jgi:hypothetical protein